MRNVHTFLVAKSELKKHAELRITLRSWKVPAERDTFGVSACCRF